MMLAYSDALAGSTVLRQAKTKSCAVTGLPSLHLASARNQKVAPSLRISHFSATPGARRLFSSSRNKPSITCPSTKPLIWSAVRLLSRLGGSSSNATVIVLVAESTPLLALVEPERAERPVISSAMPITAASASASNCWPGVLIKRRDPDWDAFKSVLQPRCFYCNFPASRRDSIEPR